MPSTTRIKEIQKSLRTCCVDPFEIAAEAIERGDRLALEVQRLEKLLSDQSLSANA
tara:strand:- start:190 stop:357 length:168 start_codon:yes stop_codon:yes gene_type:complete